MTLFSMAIKNVKRNFYNYFVYFVSMVFSIMIFYIFTSIQFNEQVIALTAGSLKIDSGFKAASIVIAIFAAIFIWYSNSFFTKRRKKEIALYSMMGVKKKEIGRMLFYENIAMGTLALGTGILIGSLLSKVFIMLLVKLMGFSIAIKFAIMPKAIINTLITFAILFLITSIHGYTIIYRFKLIELFKAKSKGEKEPKASKIIAILSIIFIGGGYTLYYNSFRTDFMFAVFSTLILVVIGTYLFFSSFTVFIIKITKKNKKRYFKGINMIRTSQLLYSIKSNSRTLATIAILSATTLTAMGITSSIFYDFKTKTKTRYPFTYAFGNIDKNLDKKIKDVIDKYPKNKLINSVDIEFLKLKCKLPNIYKNGAKPGETTVFAISESKFNEIAKARGLNERITLNNSNEIVLFYEHYMPAFMDSYKDKTAQIQYATEYTQAEIIDFKTYPLLNTYMIYNELIIVKDEVYNKYYDENNIYRVTAYNTDNKKNSEDLTEELKTLVHKPNYDEEFFGYSFSSYYEYYQNGLISSGLFIFVGSFLGLVFLMATGSIIFFKQLSEAADDKERYILLKKIGVNKKEIRSSISKQILFVFLLPLILGIIHSSVAVSLLDTLLNLNLTIPIGISIAAYTLIYMIYYVITVNSYCKIVNSDL